MASKKPTGLGRGLGALLGEDVLRTESTGCLHVPVAQVESCSTQPRKSFSEDTLQELADSIREHGILQPLIVRRLASGYYQIVAGERRWRAARLAELSEVPVLVIEADDRKAAELAMIENLQREDLNPIEEAAGFQALIETHHMTQEDAARQVGKSRSAVTNALRLLTLPASVRELVESGRLSAGHARALLALAPEMQEEAAQTVVADGLSVRQTEVLVKRLNSAAKEQSDADEPPSEIEPPKVDYVAAAAKDLSGRIGRGVRILPGKKKGRVELEYYGDEDLNDLLEALALIKIRKASEEGQGSGSGDDEAGSDG